jgi:hypothetical protein
MAFAGTVGGATAVGDTGTAGFIVANNCIEHQGFFEGSDAEVAPRLPRGYTAERDPAGKPLLFARAERCDVSLGGVARPATMASFGIVIQSPDGRGCSSGAPAIGPIEGQVPPVCNWYVLFWLANDRRIVDWLRSGTPGFPAVYVPNLVFRLGSFDPAIGGAPFHFQAPPPAPSPFSLDDVGRERPGELSVRGGYWVSTPPNTIKVAFSTDSLTSGDATGTVRTVPGSEMARLLGGDQASYLPGYSALAAERWSYGSYRKQVLGPAPAGEIAHSFAGSCSVQGTVRFTPPATNTLTPLTYDYVASGKCSGDLDGRKISNDPVALEHSGPAEGSCPQAYTTAPGQGEIAFSNGPAIDYTLDFTDVLSQVTFSFYGRRSGTVDAQGTFLTQRTPPDLPLQCGGSGAATAPMDLTLTTESPLVSLTASNTRTAPSTAHSMRVTVAPNRTRSGRRTSFAFRVRSASGRPLSRAIVRLAGRQARTGSHGRAHLTLTLRRPGRWVVRVSRRGYRTATAAIIVRPATVR